MSNGQFTAGRKARRFLLGACAASCFGATAAEPQQAPTAQAPAPIAASQARAVVSAIFDRLDCDMDGTVETAEVDDHFAQVWLPVDRDGSRSLSPAEYSRLHFDLSDDASRALFDDADANADGKVSAGELRLHLQRLIRQVDTDDDHEVSRADAGLKPAAPADAGPTKAKRQQTPT